MTKRLRSMLNSFDPESFLWSRKHSIFEELAFEKKKKFVLRRFEI